MQESSRVVVGTVQKENMAGLATEKRLAWVASVAGLAWAETISLVRFPRVEKESVEA